MSSPSDAESSSPVPDTQADALASVVAFARAVTGTLRPVSLFERLAQEIKASFGPVPVLVTSIDQQGAPESANGATSDAALTSAVSDVLLAGQPVMRRDAADTLLAVPLLGRRAVLGAIALRLGREAQPADLRTLQAMSAVASVALEGSRLVETMDQSRQRWDEAIDAVSLALCLLDRGGRIDRVNRSFTELLSLPPVSVTGRPWQAVLPREWHEGVTRALAGPGREEELRQGEQSIAVTAFRSSPGDPGRAVLLFENTTDRRLLQERLLQSGKLSAIGQLIAGVAHDLNNPLTSVVGFADFLAEAPDVPPRILEPLRVIQQEAERASNIVKNLLSFARRQESRQVARLQPILEATVALFRNQLSGDRIALELFLPADLPTLDLNPNQIQQVFVNLIQNAAQAIQGTGKPGTIRVAARRWMDGVAIEVSDDGPGMPPEHAAQAFEPFFTTKPEGQGTGLGLSISQGIVKEHGGRITLSARAEGGCSFTVELPGRVRPREEPPEPAPAPPVRPLSVLVLDDEPHILHYIRSTLEAWGHTVVTATDGHAGLERAVAEPFDLIISDLRMPRLGGREFFEALKTRVPESARRVAFSTGDTVRGDTLDFLESSGRPCLHKPFSLAELRALLRDASV
ncbi:MAG: ATP-binding protein [Gemmatimonadales bacterium]